MSDLTPLPDRIIELEAAVKMLNERLVTQHTDMLSRIVEIRGKLTLKTTRADRLAIAAQDCFDTLEAAGWPDCAERLRSAVSALERIPS